ncbi:hypothetical protein OIDMADRAFT_129991, partial [Oidiodendron maius Zn]
QVCKGDNGKGIVRGQFYSMLALHEEKPDLVPEPLGWGTYEKKPDVHFFLSSFHKMTGDIPNLSDFVPSIADMHNSGRLINGKFGNPFKFDNPLKEKFERLEREFDNPVTTYQGPFPQHDGVYDTWEEYFSADIQHFFDLEEISQGQSSDEETSQGQSPDEEMARLRQVIVERVIPRLLRPIEREIVPTLVHGNLCDGNVSAYFATDLPIIFGASCLYAHNEYELAPWRSEQGRLNHTYRKKYTDIIPESKPRDEFDSRNQLYSM